MIKTSENLSVCDRERQGGPSEMKKGCKRKEKKGGGVNSKTHSRALIRVQ